VVILVKGVLLIIISMQEVEWDTHLRAIMEMQQITQKLQMLINIKLKVSHLDIILKSPEIESYIAIQ
jgi:hypothetical protein